MSRPDRSLLATLQALLERTYRMETGIEEIGRYVIGDEGYRRFYGPLSADRPAAPPGGSTWAARGAARAGAGASARVLVRDGPGAVGVHIYYPDELIRRLEENPPTRGLGERNVDPFATFVEELDHFLLIAERARLGRPVSLLELELHANVTKYLVCALFLAAAGAGRARAPLGARERQWLLWHLFEKAGFAEEDPRAQQRYRDASRFARRFLGRLESERGALPRLALLRAFHDATHQGKLASLA